MFLKPLNTIEYNKKKKRPNMVASLFKYARITENNITKLKAVLDVINKGLSKNSIARSIGDSTTDIRKWVRMYEYYGPDGLSIQNRKYNGD